MQGHQSSAATMMIVLVMLAVLEAARAARVCAAGVPPTAAAGTSRTSGVATAHTNDHVLVLRQQCPRRPSGTAGLSTATCTERLWLALVLALLALASVSVTATSLAPPRSAAMYRSRVLCAEPLSLAHS